MSDLEPARLMDWFTVPSTEQHLIGVPLQIRSVSAGYERALDHARALLDQPHRRVERDLLTADCRELAAAMIQIAREDGDALSLAEVFSAMLLETARRESIPQSEGSGS